MTVIDEARKALEGVTPGTWEEVTPADGLWPPRVFSGSTVICMVDNSDMPHEEKMYNARFIAWAREGVPALLAEIAAKDAEIARLREAMAHTADQALAAEIPVGYGPEDKGAWTQGYDAAIRHARRALKGETHE